LGVARLDCRRLFFFSSRRRHTRFSRDWSSDVCSSDLGLEHLLSSWAETEQPSSSASGMSNARLHASSAKEKLEAAKADLVESIRSEERRVGKECRSGWTADQCKKRGKTQGTAVIGVGI